MAILGGSAWLNIVPCSTGARNLRGTGVRNLWMVGVIERVVRGGRDAGHHLDHFLGLAHLDLALTL